MKGKTAFITGGASGIGRALGEALAVRGATVILADRQIELAREVAAAICSNGGRAEARELDVRDASAFVALANDVAARHGGIDYFFNNAGIGVGGEMADYDRDAWDEVLDVNVRGVAYGIQAVYPIMRRQRRGHIINTASVAGLLPAPGLGSYAASKHAVVGLSKALRIEAAAFGVRVSALCPGVIRTPILTGGVFGRHVGRQLVEEQLRETMERMRPMEAAEFAVEVLEDVERDEPYIVVPRWWRAIWLVDRLFPRLGLWAFGRVHAKTLAAIDAHGVEASGREAPAPGVHA
ncbi:MAG: SDR family oxidoreductase [Sandaracinaceae bacterium]|nr:SDR family oxidoreductase [Sandaracinaceae bacterium]